MKLILEPAEQIAAYVAMLQRRPPAFGQFAAIGQLNSQNRLTAGIVFNGFDFPSICMHMSGERFSAALINAAMSYAFEQCKCNRITGLIAAKNAASRRFAEQLGAKLEGVMRRASLDDDICVYGLLAEDAQKWLTPRYRQKRELAFQWAVSSQISSEKPRSSLPHPTSAGKPAPR
jgi:RimJ/RimL family protein N-acetyltransferase